LNIPVVQCPPPHLPRWPLQGGVEGLTIYITGFDISATATPTLAYTGLIRTGSSVHLTISLILMRVRICQLTWTYRNRYGKQPSPLLDMFGGRRNSTVGYKTAEFVLSCFQGRTKSILAWPRRLRQFQCTTATDFLQTIPPRNEYHLLLAESASLHRLGRLTPPLLPT
jgi:hypothetical protein